MAVVAGTKLPSVATKPRRDREEEVMVWPDLVFAEFVAATLFTITLLLLSWAINAPLLDRANGDLTPNPSKAPWYFLNLQEMLLHMHPALAGVVVPTIALILLAVIPYIDRKNEGQGVWWGTKNAKQIAMFAAVYAALITIGLIIFDAYFDGFGKSETSKGLRTLGFGGGLIEWPEWTKRIWTPLPGMTTGGPPLWGEIGLDVKHWNVFDPNANARNLHIHLPNLVVEQMIPVGTMALAPALLVWLVRPFGRSLHDAMVALFTGFMACWLTLTIIGTGFRGKGMEITALWDITVDEE